MRGYLNNETENAKRLVVHSADNRTYKQVTTVLKKMDCSMYKAVKTSRLSSMATVSNFSEIEEKILNLKEFAFDNVAVVALKRNTGAVLRLGVFLYSQAKCRYSGDQRRISTKFTVLHDAV